MAIATLAVAAASHAASLGWAYPTPPRPGGLPPGEDPARLVGLPGSAVRLPVADLYGLTKALNWYPERVAGAPAAVMHGENGALACGSCHLPGGGGRPENAVLAGLPAGYIVRQIAAFASGGRSSVNPGWRPTRMMTEIAGHATPADVTAAADWFSRQRFTAHVRVIESERAPRPIAQGGLYSFDNSATELLGQRILEGPTDFSRHERRDPDVGYIAYVPPGAIARGAALAASGGPAGQPCSACHGTRAQGELGPPLAGRFATYLVRQLANFRAGARSAPEAAPMRTVAARLTDAQMIDLAAYMASLPPR